MIHRPRLSDVIPLRRSTLPPRPSSLPAPQPAPSVTRAIDVFLHYLEAEGCRVVFGIPGGLLHPFFEVVEGNEDLTLVVSKHEEGAAFMADGYARATGRVGVCLATSGPGATNLLTGVACAYADGVPMLVVTGQVASAGIGRGAAQETGREDMDIVAMFRPVTKYSAMITSPDGMAQHLRRALRMALTGRPGPVHLNVPVDFWERPLEEEWFDPRPIDPRRSTFDRNAVPARQRAPRWPPSAPCLLAGSGVASAGAREAPPRARRAAARRAWPPRRAARACSPRTTRSRSA